MATAIRKHLRDFIAVAVLVVVAIAVTLYILEEQRLRIPILEEKPFEMKAEFETAQAVVPGQGQSIRVAGVKIGDVQSVGLENGHGVVTFAIDRNYLPIYKNATILMRPQTGLKDMFFELDPGTKSAGEAPEDYTVPASNTAPDVNLDEILQALDGDTQAYLRLLLVGAGKGLDNRDQQLAQLLGGLGPINNDLRQLNSKVAERQQNVRTLIHNFRELTGAVGRANQDLTQLVSSSNSALARIAEQDPSVQRAVALLPSTLNVAEKTLNDVSHYASVLGPTFNDLRPFARNLDEANNSLSSLATATTPTLKNQIRPFVRAARKPVPDLRKAAQEYSSASPRLTVIAKKLNKFGNMAAHNPHGAEPTGTPGRDEGYLYWAGWLAHNGNTVFQAADGNTEFRRIYFTVGCSQLKNIVTGGADMAPIPGLSELINGITSGIGNLGGPVYDNDPCPQTTTGLP
jgi:phospholipid/cholesterol/gamma-HCH transport system substrate-binding protein